MMMKKMIHSRRRTIAIKFSFPTMIPSKRSTTKLQWKRKRILGSIPRLLVTMTSRSQSWISIRKCLVLAILLRHNRRSLRR